MRKTGILALLLFDCYLLPLQMAQLGPLYGNGMPPVFPQYQMPMWPQLPPNMGHLQKSSPPSAPKRQKSKTDQIPETQNPNEPQPKKPPPKQPLKQPPPTPAQPEEETQPPQVRLAQQDSKPESINGLRGIWRAIPSPHTYFLQCFSVQVLLCMKQNLQFLHSSQVMLQNLLKIALQVTSSLCVIKNYQNRGTRLAPSVEHAALDLTVMSLSPTFDVQIT